MADRVAEIRARLAAATDASSWYVSGDNVCCMPEEGGVIIASVETITRGEADAALIAAAPADLEWACDEIERLTRERDEALDNANVSHKKAHRFSLERDAAYRDGATAMRARAIEVCLGCDPPAKVAALMIEAEPIPEPKR